MKVLTPEILWHDREPIYGLDVGLSSCREFYRIASAGADKTAKVWKLRVDWAVGSKVKIDFAANLNRLTRTANCAKFSIDGSERLAIAGDDSDILLWSYDTDIKQNDSFDSDDIERPTERWKLPNILRGHLEEVYDVSWSSDSLKLASASVDHTVIIWDTMKATRLYLLNEARSLVQGVAIDPLGKFLVSHSVDRSVRVYNGLNKLKEKLRLTARLFKVASKDSSSAEDVPNKDENAKVEKKSDTVMNRLFLDDTGLFFRRLAFSPDGLLLIAPSGEFSKAAFPNINHMDSGLEVPKNSEGCLNGSWVFLRNKWRRPILFLPSGERPSIVVRFCPHKFTLQNPEGKCPTPYRYVFCILSEDSIVLYDTEALFNPDKAPRPLGIASGLHYLQLTDAAWSHDGRLLAVSSSDGYCSIITFQDRELGTPYIEPIISSHEIVLPILDILFEKIIKNTPPLPETPKSGKVVGKVTPKNQSKNDKNIDSFLDTKAPIVTKPLSVKLERIKVNTVKTPSSLPAKRATEMKNEDEKPKKRRVELMKYFVKCPKPDEKNNISNNGEIKAQSPLKTEEVDVENIHVSGNLPMLVEEEQDEEKHEERESPINLTGAETIENKMEEEKENKIENNVGFEVKEIDKEKGKRRVQVTTLTSFV